MIFGCVHSARGQPPDQTGRGGRFKGRLALSLRPGCRRYRRENAPQFDLWERKVKGGTYHRILDPHRANLRELALERVSDGVPAHIDDARLPHEIVELGDEREPHEIEQQPLEVACVVVLLHVHHAIPAGGTAREAGVVGGMAWRQHRSQRVRHGDQYVWVAAGMCQMVAAA